MILFYYYNHREYNILLILNQLILIMSSVEIEAVFTNDSGDVNRDESKYEYCVCVPYWQCKEDYSGLIEDGINIIDVRYSARNSCSGEFDVCCQVECGKRGSSTTELRITGESNEAGFGEFPWMLGILKDGVYRCGGSLIHPHVVLTAAHCVIEGGNFIVRAGEWNWMNTNEILPHQDRAVQDVIIHLYFHLPSLRNDIALLVVDYPFVLTDNVGLVCLPRQSTEGDGRKCIATGWGKNNYREGHYQSTLKKVELPLVPRRTCMRSLQIARLGPLFNLHQSFVCAGGQMNKDTCKGDGGSPLVCPVQGRPGKYEQVGIVSWGLTCGLRNTPGVYVNTGLFRDWIDRTMRTLDFDSHLYSSEFIEPK